MTPDPYHQHLRRANKLFALGEVLKASQIWKAILKEDPTHREARERLVGVKEHLMDLSEREAKGKLAAHPPPDSSAWDNHSRSSIPNPPQGYSSPQADAAPDRPSSARAPMIRPSLDLPFSRAGSRSSKRPAPFPARPPVSRSPVFKHPAFRHPASWEVLPAIRRFREALRWRSWRGNPNVWWSLAGGLLVLVMGARLLHGYLKDRKLEADLRATRAAALATLAPPQDLSMSRQAMIEDAETALRTDPFRAFLIAEGLAKKDSLAGSELMKKARAALPGGIAGASLPEFQRHLRQGNLDAAARVMDNLLRVSPRDGDLRARAGRMHLALSFAFASQGKWDQVQGHLLRGRALFPEDKLWQARLRLLDRVRELPKQEQALWAPFLG